MSCSVFANYTFCHKKYELSLTIDMRLLHHLSALPPKQHKSPLIFFPQNVHANVSPNLTDDHKCSIH